MASLTQRPLNVCQRLRVKKRPHEISIRIIFFIGMMDELESGLSKNYLNLPLCKCLPSCNSRNYDAKVKLSNSRKNKTYVTLQFKETEFSVMERKELFGDVDFWASCGGILGLFTGFSTISLAEIAYFLLFRWLFAWIRRLWKIMRPNMLT